MSSHSRLRRLPWLVFLWFQLSPLLALAEDVPLVGLFEGHGIAPAVDSKLRRRAEIAAQRLSLQCAHFYQVRGGGTSVESSACPDGERALLRLGPEGAAAILSVLDEPRTVASQYGEPYPALLRALANTGRPELVPVILRATDRLLARQSLTDPRIRDFAQNHLDRLVAALSTLTYVTSYDGHALGLTREAGRALEPNDFREWYEQHQAESRADWRRQAIERATRLLRDPNEGVASFARCRLVEFPETRVAAIARLRAYVRRPECANWQCAIERETLQSVEPWAKWTQPEWSPI